MGLGSPRCQPLRRAVHPTWDPWGCHVPAPSTHSLMVDPSQLHPDPHHPPSPQPSPCRQARSPLCCPWGRKPGLQPEAQSRRSPARARPRPGAIRQCEKAGGRHGAAAAAGSRGRSGFVCRGCAPSLPAAWQPATAPGVRSFLTTSQVPELIWELFISCQKTALPAKKTTLAAARPRAWYEGSLGLNHKALAV